MFSKAFEIQTQSFQRFLCGNEKKPSQKPLEFFLSKHFKEITADRWPASRAAAG
jgi:hypothetical protein